MEFLNNIGIKKEHEIQTTDKTNISVASKTAVSCFQRWASTDFFEYEYEYEY